MLLKITLIQFIMTTHKGASVTQDIYRKRYSPKRKTSRSHLSNKTPQKQVNMLINLVSTLTNNLDHWCHLVTLFTQSCSWTFGANTKLHQWGVGAVIPFAVHQRVGATAMVDVSSCVPVVNDICKTKIYWYSVWKLNWMGFHGIIFTRSVHFVDWIF